MLSDSIRVYKSIDKVISIDVIVMAYPTEFLNSLEISGIPSHEIKLIVLGTP